MRPATLLKTRHQHRCFPVNFSKLLRALNFDRFFICSAPQWNKTYYRSSRPDAFLEKGILKIWSKFTREHPSRSSISIKLLEIALRQWYSPVNLLYIFRTPFPRNTSGWLLLYLARLIQLDSVKRTNIFYV